MASRPDKSATREPSPAAPPRQSRRRQRERGGPRRDDGLDELRRPPADEAPAQARCCSVSGICASAGAGAGLLLAAVIGSIVYAMFMQAILWQSLTGGKGALDPANWKEELKGSSWLVGERAAARLRRVLDEIVLAARLAHPLPPAGPQRAPRCPSAPADAALALPPRCASRARAGACDLGRRRAAELRAGASSFLLLATSTAAVSAFVLPMEPTSPMAFYSYAFMTALFIIQLATVRYASMRPGEGAHAQGPRSACNGQL